MSILITPISGLQQLDARYNVLVTLAEDEGIDSPKKLQEGLARDDTAAVRFVIWTDANLSRLEPAHQYLLIQARLREYQGKLELQLDRWSMIQAWDGPWAELPPASSDGPDAPGERPLQEPWPDPRLESESTEFVGAPQPRPVEDPAARRDIERLIREREELVRKVDELERHERSAKVYEDFLLKQLDRSGTPRKRIPNRREFERSRRLEGRSRATLKMAVGLLLLSGAAFGAVLLFRFFYEN